MAAFRTTTRFGTGTARWRLQSPHRKVETWNNFGLAQATPMSTAQPTVQTAALHSGNKNKEKEVEDNKSQWRKDSRMRDSVSSVFNTFGALNVEFSTRWLSDFQKYIPLAKAKLKEKLHKDAEKLTDAVEEKRYQMKKYVIERRLKDRLETSKQETDNCDDHSLVHQVEDMNKSIHSFYDTTLTPQLKQEEAKDVSNNASQKTIIETTKEEENEDAPIMKLFSLASSLKITKSEEKVEKKPVVRKDFVSQASIDRRTRALVQGLKQASSGMSKLKRMEELCNHLLKYPDSRGVAEQGKVLPVLLKASQSHDRPLQAQAYEALALVGYVPPPRGRGIRVLTIDGGGTKGLVAIETLKKLEAACGTELHSLFDYVCGVSTGALIAAMVFLFRAPVRDCEGLYRDFSKQMFTRNKLVGTGQLVWNHAFYDTEVWEKILRTEMGEKMLIEFARDPKCPKLSVVSSLMNVPKMKNFIFRNYNLPPGVYSNHPGNCRQKVWEVIRASSAATGYYEEFMLGDFVHQDGGLLANNPTALAIHECRLLWPHESLQCVVSLGNGQHEPQLQTTPKKSTLKNKVIKIVDSATDTETIHATLEDLLPPSTYFRFNPYMSEDFLLDEIHPTKVEKMQQDSRMYLRKNEHKVEAAVKQILLPRKLHQKAGDWLKMKADLK